MNLGYIMYCYTFKLDMNNYSITGDKLYSHKLTGDFKQLYIYITIVIKIT